MSRLDTITRTIATILTLCSMVGLWLTVLYVPGGTVAVDLLVGTFALCTFAFMYVACRER